MEKYKSIHKKFMDNKDRVKQIGGWTFDPNSNRFYNAGIKNDALELRKIHKAQNGLNLGINSITDDEKGTNPLTNTDTLYEQLKQVEESGKDPIIGGYESGLNASYAIHGKDKDILSDLRIGQDSSLSIEPSGKSYFLYPDGRKERVKP